MLLKQFVKHLMGTLASYLLNGVMNSYAIFINLVRKYIHRYGKKAGFNGAVDECIMNSILTDILVKNKET